VHAPLRSSPSTVEEGTADRTASGAASASGEQPGSRVARLAAEEQRRAVRAAQRLRILLATAACARRLGVSELSVAEIVDAGHVSRKTFYDLFESRQDCLLATFEEGVRRAAERVLPAYRGQESWRDAIRAGLCALLAFIEEEPALGGFCVIDALGAGDVVLRRRAEVLAAVANAVGGGREQARSSAGLAETTEEVIVGGALGVLHARLLADRSAAVSALSGELMAAIVRPYLGAGVAESELRRGAAAGGVQASAGGGTSESASVEERRARAAAEPLASLRIRWTYRTIAAIDAVAKHPGASNRTIGEAAGVTDPGRISKLLSRLRRLKLIENDGGPATAGLPNAWRLTERGERVVAQMSSRPRADPGGGRNR
jgi:AcrR family transcriptional regulator